LEAEIEHLLSHVRPEDTVLELGCGYGRILPAISAEAGLVVGVDTSLSSLKMAHDMLSGCRNCRLALMDAARLAFGDAVFDVVVCIQNGISAFRVDRRNLIAEGVRVVKADGIVLFSSYSDRIWSERLHWFLLQSEEGLLGEIDFGRTGDGVIVCKDGFTATTVRPEEFESLTSGLGVDSKIVEVDESSLFCEITPRRPELRSP
jgi:2-polyprenyl-6-hydroxyphenyl methylase/3-demethylubiquinone-9 3-methyltransferase